MIRIDLIISLFPVILMYPIYLDFDTKIKNVINNSSFVEELIDESDYIRTDAHAVLKYTTV